VLPLGVSPLARSRHFVGHFRKASKRDGVIVMEASYASPGFPKGAFSGRCTGLDVHDVRSEIQALERVEMFRATVTTGWPLTFF
jgi:hypothetical protein